MPSVSEEIAEAQQRFMEGKTEDELRQIINDCYDLEKRWRKKRKKQ